MTQMRLPGSLAEIQHSPEGPQVGAFFDMDGTLVAGFTAAQVAKERQRSGDLSRLDMMRSLGPVIAFARGQLDFAGMLQISTAAMEGQQTSESDEFGRRVFERSVRGLIYPEMRRIVQAHLDRGHTVVLCSSALALQVEAVAEHLGITHVLCNRLVSQDGVLTGRVVEPVIWGEGKSDAVQNFARDHDVDIAQSYFYADGDEDAALMYLVGKPRPTNPRSGMAAIAKRRGWPILRFTSRGAGGPGHLARQLVGIGAMAPLVAAGAAVGLLNQNKWAGINVLLSTYPGLLLQLNGVKVKVSGRENLEAARPAIFVFNHRTNSDGIIASALVGHDFTGVAKKDLEKNPFLGPIGKAMDMAFLERGDTAASVAELKKVQELPLKGLSIIMAPEGTRLDTTTVGQFKKGAFRMAMAAGIPIVPIIIRNAEDIAGKDSQTMNPGTVDVHVGEPIDVSSWTLKNLDRNIAKVHTMYVDRLSNWPHDEETT